MPALSRETLIRILCITLVAVTLALGLILAVAVVGGTLAETTPAESEEDAHFRPFFPEGTPDIGDIIGSLDPGDFTRDPETTTPADPDIPDVTLPEWESDFEWPTLPPSLETNPDWEVPTLPEDWDTLPEEWDTLPEEWGDLPYGPDDLADVLAGMDGSLDMPAGALAAGVASQLTVMEIYAEKTDTLYLKMQSFGAYNGRGWNEAGMYGGAIDVTGYSANYLPHFLMNEITPFAGYPLTVTPKMDVRVIPYYLVADGDMYQLQTSDVKAVGAYDQTYTLYYRPYGTHVYASLAPYYLASFEAAYSAYAEQSYLTIDDTTLAYMKLIIEEQGFDKNDPDIVEKVAAYIQNAATYNLAYDQNLDREPNVALAFLGAYKEGVCRHYATAATLLYRALGIPARYTVGFMTDVTAGETTAVKGADAHAWVEVYEAGFGWRYVEVTGSPAGSDPTNPPETGTGTSTGTGSGTLPPTDPTDDPSTWGDQIAGVNGSLAPAGNIPGAVKDGVVFWVNTHYAQRMLLKLKSFGNYTGLGFASVTETPPEIYGYTAAYLTGIYQYTQGLGTQQTVTIRSPQGTVAAPYYPSMSDAYNGRLSVGDTRITGTVGKNEEITVSFNPTFPGYIPNSVNSTLFAEYTAYAARNFTAVDSATAAYLNSLIAAQGWMDMSVEEVIPAVAAYLQAYYTLNPDYDVTLDYESNVVVAFLDTYREGSSRHFAAAATLIYRALGIPARYTVGYLVTTEAGQDTRVTGHDAYAWCEVYAEGIGWLAVDVAEYAKDVLPAITLKPVTENYLYDGESHSHSGTLTGFEAYEAMGYTYEAVVNGKRGACGAVSTVISSLILYDPAGNDVTNRFHITTESGILRVYVAELWFQSDSQTKTYDGIPLTTVAVSSLSGDLPEGYYVGITCTGSQTTVGTGYAAFDIRIWYRSGTGAPEDRTHYFIIHKQYGTLAVTPAPLTLKADDAEKVYDGTPLTADGISVIEGTLAPMDSIYSYTLEGSQTRVGRSENVITDIVIRNHYGEDVTACYAIETVAGSLKITAG